jgi:glucose-6-phosphate 1-epimerase
MKPLPRGAHLETGPGGLERLVLRTDSGDALVYLHGAHVAHYQPAGGRPVLWMSQESRFEAGQPLRGGIPVCFPWFGPNAGSPEAPVHGFARILPWSLADVTEDGGSLRAALELPAATAARSGFPGELSLSLAVVVGRVLRLELTASSGARAPVAFEAALHSYFAVSDVRRVVVRGLEDAPFVDKTAAMARRPAEGVPVAIRAETDRVYTGASGAVEIEDTTWGRRIVVTKAGSATTVVWNPWVAKAKAMPDFGDDEWTGMLCVEAANALEDAVTLPPGGSHVMTATLDALPV